MSNPKSSDLGPVFCLFSSLQILECLLGIPISARIFRSEKWDKHLKAWASFITKLWPTEVFSWTIQQIFSAFLTKQILWFNSFLGSFLKSKIVWKLRLFPIFAFCLLPTFLGFKSGSEQRKCKYIDLYYLCLVWKETGIVVLETCWGYPVGCGYPKWPWIGCLRMIQRLPFANACSPMILGFITRFVADGLLKKLGSIISQVKENTNLRLFAKMALQPPFRLRN